MDNIYTQNGKLIISIPLKQKCNNPYDDADYEIDNIIGVITPNPRHSSPDMGFCYQIDRSYKGKGPDITDYFYKSEEWTEEEFKKLCEKLKIDNFKYEACSKCGRPLFGVFTWGKGGPECGEYSGCKLVEK